MYADMLRTLAEISRGDAITAQKLNCAHAKEAGNVRSALDLGVCSQGQRNRRGAWATNLRPCLQLCHAKLARRLGRQEKARVIPA